MQVLNGYIDELSRGNAPPPANLLFYVKNEQTDQLAQVAANLSTSGSLAPLFFAFGFINADELRDAMANGPSVEDTNFLQWLRETVAEAVRTAELHDALKWQIRKYRSALEERFGLASVTVRGSGGRGENRRGARGRVH